MPPPTMMVWDMLVVVAGLPGLNGSGGGGELSDSGSFDCVTRDEAARHFAQDDGFLGGYEVEAVRAGSGAGSSSTSAV